MSKVFISHSTPNDAFVDKLVKDLNAVGIETFVDHHNMKNKLSQPWPKLLEQALNDCQQMIAVISSFSTNSQNCINEWYHFINNRKEVIPLWLSDQMFFQFSAAQRVDFRKNYDAPLKELIEFLKDKEVISLGTIHPKPQSDVLPAEIHNYYSIINKPDKHIGIATGNVGELIGVDILVNSENILLRMDTPGSSSVSAAINAYGADWPLDGEPVYLVDDELKAEKTRLGLQVPVAPATVVVTSGGRLSVNGIKHVIHAVAVEGGRGKKFTPVSRVKLSRCVFNVLSKIDELNGTHYLSKDPMKTVAIPVFGAGRGGDTLENIAPMLVERAIDYLETQPTSIEGIYFLAYTQKDLDAITGILSKIPELDNPK